MDEFSREGGDDVISGNLAKHWYVACVKRNHERKIADNLVKMGIRSYVPTQIRFRKWSDRMKKIEQVLIPMMVFVYASEPERKQTFNLYGLSHYLSIKGQFRAATIPSSQMEQFMFMMDYSENTICYNPDQMLKGDMVEVIKGPLAGLRGVLVTDGDRTKVGIQLDFMGTATVDMPVGYIKKVEKV